MTIHHDNHDAKVLDDAGARPICQLIDRWCQNEAFAALAAASYLSLSPLVVVVVTKLGGGEQAIPINDLPSPSQHSSSTRRGPYYL